MSTYEFVFFFSVSLVSGVIALICWLLELTCKKLHLNAISEIFNILKRTAILSAILFGGFFILMLSLTGLSIVVTYVADFIFALF